MNEVVSMRISLSMGDYGISKYPDNVSLSFELLQSNSNDSCSVLIIVTKF